MSKGNIYLGVAVSSNYQPTLIQESKPEQPVQKTPEQLSQECVFCGIWLSAEAMEAHLKNLHSEEVKTNK